MAEVETTMLEASAVSELPQNSAEHEEFSRDQLSSKLSSYRIISPDELDRYYIYYSKFVKLTGVTHFDFKAYAHMPPNALATPDGLNRLLGQCGPCSSFLNVVEADIPGLVKTTNWDYRYIPTASEVRSGFKTVEFVRDGSFVYWSPEHDGKTFETVLSYITQIPDSSYCVVDHCGTEEHAHVEVFRDLNLYTFRTANILWRWRKYDDDDLVITIGFNAYATIYYEITHQLIDWYKYLKTSGTTTFLVDYSKFEYIEPKARRAVKTLILRRTPKKMVHQSDAD